MSVPIWQPTTWIVFHHLAKNYREEYKEHYIRFFDSFKTIIPCKTCRTHYQQNINKENMSIESNINSNNVFRWTIDLHNSVNRQNHKKVWSYDKANQHYSQYTLTNPVIKLFILDYVKANFRKGPEKTSKLMEMLRSIAYLHPNEQKRKKLIDFREKFSLSHDTMKNWLYAFLLILKS